MLISTGLPDITLKRFPIQRKCETCAISDNGAERHVESFPDGIYDERNTEHSRLL